VGDGAIVSAGSIVTRDVDDFQVVAGNPAKVVGDAREIDNKYLEDDMLREWYEEWQ